MVAKACVGEISQVDPEAGVIEEFIERLHSPEKRPVESSTLDPQTRVREILRRSTVWWPWWEGRSK